MAVLERMCGNISFSRCKTTVVPMAIFNCSFGLPRQGFVGQGGEGKAGCSVVPQTTDSPNMQRNYLISLKQLICSKGTLLEKNFSNSSFISYPCSTNISAATQNCDLDSMNNRCL